MRNHTNQILVLAANLLMLVGCNSSSPGGSEGNAGGNQSSGGSVGSGGSSKPSTTVGNGGASATASATTGPNASGGTSTSSSSVNPSNGGASTTTPSAGGTGPSAGGAKNGGANSSNGGAVASSTGGRTSSGNGGAVTAGRTGSSTKPGAGAPGVGGSSVAAGGNSAAAGKSAAGGTTTAGSSSCASLPASPAATSSIITFNDNGAWCWYQDERAIVDPTAQKLVVGSVASGGSRNGNIEAVVYDLATKTVGKVTKLGNLSVDDHNAPAFNILSSGKYLAVWAGHRIDCNSYYSVYDGSAWAAQKNFDWKTQGCPWDSDSTHMVTYSNLWYVGDQLFDFARSVSTSPNALTYSASGNAFSYYGRLTSTKTVGYVAGYYKYWGNNTDRIDFVGTEAHPRDNDNNLWHGYIKGDVVYNSKGDSVDTALKGTRDAASATDITAYTKVFATGTTLGGVKLEHAWNHDIVRYDDGTVAILGQARVTGTGSDDPDKRLIYARWDGSSWKLTYLGKLGTKMYSSEQDYTGLSALHPNDPSVIYASFTMDPKTGTALSHREIYKGVSCDQGATWDWATITSNSSQDNFRPIVPTWDSNHTVLLWFKGTYTSAQSFQTSIVGLVMDGT